MSIDNRDDLIDIRELIEEFEEAEGELENQFDPIHDNFIELKETLKAEHAKLCDPTVEDINGRFDQWVVAVAQDGSNEAAHEYQRLLDEGAGEDLETWAKWVEAYPDHFAYDEAVAYLRLKPVLDDLQGNGGDHQWRGNWYPVTLIRESYFEDYAKQYAEDVGAIDDNARWPGNCIDWQKAASELQHDYSSIEFGDITYYR